jgi:hypothetical protein
MASPYAAGKAALVGLNPTLLFGLSRQYCRATTRRQITPFSRQISVIAENCRQDGCRKEQAFVEGEEGVEEEDDGSVHAERLVLS